MRILHITRRYPPLIGGTERYVRDLAVEQRQRGHDVRVLTLDRDVTGIDRRRLAPRAQRDGVRVRRLPGVGNQRLAITARPDVAIPEVMGADVVHAHDLRFQLGTVLMRAAVARRPVLLHTHGMIFHTEWGWTLKRLLARYAIGPSLRVASVHVVASSEPDRRLLLSLAPYLASLTRTLENAIDLNEFRTAPRHRVPGQIVTIGRVVASKGIDDLLGAVALLTEDGWRLTVIGPIESDEHARLAALLEHHGIANRVTFAGAVDRRQLLDMLSSAAVAAFPSRSEGFGLAVLEAMAAGVPVIARDIDAHRALLGEVDAHALVDFADHRRAADAIAARLALEPDAASQLGDALRSRADRYDVRRLADEVEELYAFAGVARP